MTHIKEKISSLPENVGKVEQEQSKQEEMRNGKLEEEQNISSLEKRLL